VDHQAEEVAKPVVYRPRKMTATNTTLKARNIGLNGSGYVLIAEDGEPTSRGVARSKNIKTTRPTHLITVTPHH